MFIACHGGTNEDNTPNCPNVSAMVMRTQQGHRPPDQDLDREARRQQRNIAGQWAASKGNDLANDAGRADDAGANDTPADDAGADGAAINGDAAGRKGGRKVAGRKGGRKAADDAEVGRRGGRKGGRKRGSKGGHRDSKK